MPFTSLDLFRTQIEQLLPYVSPVLVYPRAYSGVKNWITGGSALLVRTEENRFIITADHFVREIDNLKTQREIVVLFCGINSAPIDISSWATIAHNEFVDICTIQVPHDFDAAELNKTFFVLDRWPPTQAEIYDQALVIGFPADQRHVFEWRINARALPIGGVITDSGPRRFIIADEKDEREILINPDNLTFPQHVGGMSGSPVFRISENTLPEFIGVLVEGSDGLRGTYFCSHSHFLLLNGQLDYNRIPPG